MGIKLRLTVLSFLQFFVWGAWLTSVGLYMFKTLHFNGGQIGAVFTTLGIASLFMPVLLGIVADRWMNAERVLGIAHIFGAGFLYWSSTVTDPTMMYWAMLFNSLAYMPTISLNNSVSYNILVQKGFNVVKDFPPIRVWGTVGFICAMWVTDLLGWSASAMQLQFASVFGLVLGIYSFTLPPCPPAQAQKNQSFVSMLGLDAFVLFQRPQMAIFFIFSMLIGICLQITNAFGQSFLDSFNGVYPNSFAVLHPGLLMSVSQISETVFILTIPFFLYKFGIKNVMLFSIFAWVLRFGLFGIGNPESGLVFLVASMIIYGMAFDFFNISGSLYVETETDSNIRASAQGLFMIMTNGLGAIIGGIGSGKVIDHFTNSEGEDWVSIWYVFAGYALVLGVVFALVFKYKHVPEKIKPNQDHFSDILDSDMP